MAIITNFDIVGIWVREGQYDEEHLNILKGIFDKGITFWHNPDNMDGFSSSTLQIGDPSIVAYAFNKKVISNSRNRKKYEKQIKSKEYKLGKLINRLEYELNYVEESDIRRIIRYKYEEDLNWVQIMFKMNYNNEDTARKKLERFLEKN